MANMNKNMNECVPTDHVSVCMRNTGGERAQESLSGVPVNTKVTLVTAGHSKHRTKATPPCLCLSTSKGAQVSLKERRALRGRAGCELN